MTTVVPSAVIPLLEGSVDASVVLDKDRRILYYNRAYENISPLRGRKLRQAVDNGARCYEVLPLTICESECVGCVAIESQRRIRMDEIDALSTKEPMTFIVTAAPIEDCIVETYRDVTAEARIQRRLKILLKQERQVNSTLEEQVSARTSELEEAQAHLVLKEKMSALGGLVAGIAHELNNPINFVYGNVDFLAEYLNSLLSLVDFLDKRDDLAPALRRELDNRKADIEYDYLVEDSVSLVSSIRTGAERAASIVRDLTSFSRTSAGEIRVLDLVVGINATLNLLSPLITNRIEVRRVFPEDVPKITCNAGHINQVLMNVLANAAQAIDGKGWIEVEIEVVDSGQKVRVVITDSGKGVKEENRLKLIDPFFTTKEVGQGTGLGLWVSHSIIAKHGGTLTCTSPPGQGASFSIVLPINPTEVEAHD